MGSLLFFAFSWWGILLQAFAIIHFIRRRPDTFWLWIILIGGWLGALVYIALEAVPDAGLLRQSFKVFPDASASASWKRPFWTIPPPEIMKSSATSTLRKGSLPGAAGLRQGDLVPHRLARSVLPSGGGSHPDGDFTAALPDLERVAAEDPTYDFHRAAGLLAHAYANTGQTGQAEALFRQVTRISTSSETYYNYACFLASEQRNTEAREWARQILAKNPPCPDICVAARAPGSARPMRC